MRSLSSATSFACALLIGGAALAGAQRPTEPRTRQDSLAKARADSAALADSLALMKALEADKKPTVDTVRGAVGPINARMLPDISVVGDLVGDASPNQSTQEDGSRYNVREVELAVQAVVDPYFRGDIFLGFSDIEKVSIEQAFFTATSLPWQVEGRLGRFLMPFGKENTIHRHDLHTVEYPYVIQRFLNEEGQKGTGLYAGRVFSPFGFFQEIILTSVDQLGETEDLRAIEAPNRTLGGLGFSGRLRNYWDLGEASNVELSGSAMTGRVLQPLSGSVLFNGETVNAVVARQSTFGVDLTYRWRPLQQGLYQSFILQAEVMRQVNERESSLRDRIPSNPTTGGPFFDGPTRDFTGGYAFARWQLTRRLFVSARGDVVQDPVDIDNRTLTAGSGYLEFYPSEFSKLMAMYERRSVAGEGENRILFQATFALGPHRPHPF